VRRFQPISPALLAGRLCDLLDERHAGITGGGQPHPLRVALDAPGWVELQPLIADLERRLAINGHLVAVVRGADFYRDASLRFEYGKTDVESFYTGWLDSAALQREVLTPLGPGGTGSYLPALRDPVTNRSARTSPVALSADAVVLVRGELLLGTGLAFDLVVHFSVSRQALRRLAPPEQTWALPAFDRYEIDVDPAGQADVVVRYDDPSHPALFSRVL
jgi:hypothetical protein